MARRERLIVHALLGVSLLLHAITLAGGTPAAVMAGVRSLIEDPGPAERLTLVGTEPGDEPLVLTARKGRLAWSDRAAHQVWAIAVVDDREVISRLMTKDLYNDRRQALREELQPQSAEFERRMQAIIAESQGIDPENEAAMQEAFQRYQQVQQEFQQWQQSARNRGDLLEGEILKEAFGELVAAVEVVADRRAVDLVLRSVRADADFPEADSRSVSLSMRMRTALLRPEGIDMTEDVLEELGLLIRRPPRPPPRRASARTARPTPHSAASRGCGNWPTASTDTWTGTPGLRSSAICTRRIWPSPARSSSNSSPAGSAARRST